MEILSIKLFRIGDEEVRLVRILPSKIMLGILSIILFQMIIFNLILSIPSIPPYTVSAPLSLSFFTCLIIFVLSNLVKIQVITFKGEPSD